MVELITPPPSQPTVGKFIKPHPNNNKRTHARFEDEAHISLSLSGHPAFPLVERIIRDATISISKMWGIERQEYVRSMIVMEQLGPQTLRDYINWQGKLSSGKTAEIAAELALGLSRMHSLGIIHRDFKHDNVMLDNDGRGHVKVIDFGLASDKKKPMKEIEGVLIGSPSYMAPEAYFEVQNKCESDLFSLGIVILECLKSERIFKMEDHDHWQGTYGQTPYLSNYLRNIGQIGYLADNLNHNPQKTKEIEKIIHLTPEETYALWLTKDPEEIRAALQKRLDLAIKILSPFLDEYEIDRLATFYATLNPESPTSPKGSTKLQSYIDSQLSTLTCDEELKAILTKLLDLDLNKRAKNEYVLARDLAKIAVRYNPELRMVEPFYTLIGRCTSISNIEEPAQTQNIIAPPHEQSTHQAPANDAQSQELIKSPKTNLITTIKVIFKKILALLKQAVTQ